jgi:hypothetical protein
MICTLRQYNENYQVEEDDVGREYRANRAEEEGIKAIDRKARGKETTRKTDM